MINSPNKPIGFNMCVGKTKVMINDHTSEWGSHWRGQQVCIHWKGSCAWWWRPDNPRFQVELD